ncbi:Na+/H+ antiporter [Cumulibacter manganitolerans]|uniref:Na+/H+ antiporter n=1 Tax=Cumulibacter manganitolerans TaxID=1884992 RepID=UPI001297C8CD|nr:Na+/H+ antiporter [Cumulibacter manganitolerans]
MHVVEWLVAFGAVIVAGTSITGRLRVPPPLLLVAAGAAASYVPIVPRVELDPELILLGLLPPLLYAAAIGASLTDFRAEKRPIAMLSVGLVVFTALAVGAIAYWLLPIPLAAALALGAIVGPPDAVAASAVARRIGLPRRVVTILEGESLLNDATAIVLLRLSIVGITGVVTFGEVALSFAVSVVGGVLIGWVVARLSGWMYRHAAGPVHATAASLLVPFIAYVPAELIHASGVVATVVAGLLTAYRAYREQSPAIRSTLGQTWKTIQFVLENAVFLLIGLQVHPVISAVASSSLGWPRVLLACGAVLLTVLLARPLWLSGYRLLPSKRRPLPARDTAVTAWAGMRGVVTLAAALVLPQQTPHREVLIFAAMVVTAGTLLLQGLSLPWVARRLGVRGPIATEDALQQAQITESAAAAGIRALDDAIAAGALTVSEDLGEELRTQARQKTYRVWEQLGSTSETPNELRRRARLLMIQAERDEVLRIRDAGGADHEVLQQELAGLDVEETILQAVTDYTEQLRGSTLATPAVVAGECAHLQASALADCPVPTSRICEDCVREGTEPVHLRVCMACGNVGCCDSSVGTHATRHFQRTGHPVMRSFEPGELWRWCYLDETLG